MRFEIHKSTDGSAQPYWWRAVSNNNSVLCNSERLTSKQNALHTINVIRTGAPSAEIFNHTGEQM
jgi:uncharacterized protein YegP (UPF0339 family)